MNNISELLAVEAKEMMTWLRTNRKDDAEAMVQQVCMYTHLLVEKNKVMNLTATKDEREIIIRHIGDSFKCAEQIDLLQKEAGRRIKVVDLGSGAGLPGVIIGILCPDVEMTMLEATGKKANFIKESIEALNLQNCRIENARVEDFANFPGNKCGYDVVTARALAELRILCELAMPLLRVKGKMIAMKSRLWQTELENAGKAMRILGAQFKKASFYQLHDGTEDVERCFVFLEKTKVTPYKYPRSNGIPSKKPL